MKFKPSKPLEKRRKPLTVNLSDEMIEVIKSMAKNAELKPAELARQMIEYVIGEMGRHQNEKKVEEK